MNESDLDKKLKLQSRAFVLVLEKPNSMRNETWVDFLDKVLYVLKMRYWLCLHDSDFNSDGEKERPHVHLVLDYGATCRVERILNLLDEKIGYHSFVLNDEGEWIINPAIGIDVCHNRLGAIRYLMHLDETDEGKSKYPVNRVKTNSPEELRRAVACSAFGVDFKYLWEVCVYCNCNIISIIEELGLEVYQRYRQIVRDICAGLRGQF